MDKFIHNLAMAKKISSHLVSLIKVEGLISPYIVTHFDIVNS